MNLIRALTLTIALLFYFYPSAHAAETQAAPVPAGQIAPAGMPEVAAATSRPTNGSRPEPNRTVEVRLNTGGFIPLSKISLQGQDYATKPGFTLGAQMLWQLNSNLYTGLDFAYLTAGRNGLPNRKQIFADNSEFNSAEILAIMRISADVGRFRPYAIGGVGLDGTRIHIDDSPPAGHVWANTGTAERRTLVDSFRNAPALTLQLGFDYIKSASQLFGVGVSYYYIAPVTHETSPVAQTVGIHSFRGPTGGIAVSATMGFYGKR